MDTSTTMLNASSVEKMGSSFREAHLAVVGHDRPKMERGCMTGATSMRHAATFCIVLLCLKAAHSQLCPTSDLEKAIVSTEDQLRAQMGPVRLHRVEQLEDDIGPGDDEFPLRIYQVERRFSYREGNTLVLTAGGGGSFEAYVAISSDGHRVYKLGGFPEAEQDFARLVRDYKLRVVPQWSEARALFCANALYGIPPNLWMLTASNLQMSAAEHFFDMGRSDALAMAHKWWTKYQAENPTFKPGISTEQSRSSGDGVIVRLSYFWAPLEGSDSMQVKNLVIEVKPDGSCARQ